MGEDKKIKICTTVNTVLLIFWKSFGIFQFNHNQSDICPCWQRIQATQTILLVIMTDASVPEKPPHVKTEKPPHATTHKFVVFMLAFNLNLKFKD